MGYGAVGAGQSGSEGEEGLASGGAQECPALGDCEDEEDGEREEGQVLESLL